MKKIKFLAAISMLTLSLNLCANAHTPATKLDAIGMKLINANNIKERLLFDFSGCQYSSYPVAYDKTKVYDVNLHNNRIVTIYAGDYRKMSTDDEIAALLAHNIAQGVNSYKGVFKGQLFITKEGLFSKSNELKYDKQSVEYLVKAGYNPTAIITAYNKTLPEWRRSMFSRHQTANKRMLTVYDYIKQKYPQYLSDNAYTRSIYYKRFIEQNNLQNTL